MPASQVKALAVLVAATLISFAMHAAHAAQGTPTSAPVLVGAGASVLQHADLVCVSVRYPSTRVGRVSAAASVLDAIELLLQHEIDQRIDLHSPWLKGSAREAVRMMVRAESLAQARTMEGVMRLEEQSDSGEVLVVHAVPSRWLREIWCDVPAALKRLNERVQSGEANHVEAMALLEAVPSAQVPALRDDVLKLLDRAMGDGFGASADRRWVARDGGPLRQGLKLWHGLAPSAVGSAADCAIHALPEGVLGRATPDQCLLLLGHRANDPAVLAAVRGHLLDAGWTRVASLLPGPGREPSDEPGQ